MKNQKGFIQIPLLIAIIAGVLVLSGAGYLGFKKYEAAKVEQAVKDKQAQDLIAIQQKTLEETKTEVENLKQQAAESKKAQEVLQNKIQNTESQKSENNYSITALEITPYLSGVINIDCGSVEGSGSLWNLSGFGYVVMTNNHVINDSNIAKCTFNPLSNDDKIGYGIYDLELYRNRRWNDYTDIAVINFEIDKSLNDFIAKSGHGSSLPVNQLNYKVSSLRKCSTAISLGSPVAVIGYPAFSYKKIDVPDTNSTADISSRTITNGVISAFDRTVTYPIGNLPYPNYFVSAKIDSGNSGGIALSKDSSGLCVLGIPTWISIGNYETQGVVQNIYNVFYQE